MWSLGDIVPKWSKGVPTGTSSIYSVDVPIESSTYCYRVVRTDPQTGKAHFVKCYHKLVVVKDRKTGRLGNYVVFFIATNEYADSHPGNVGKRFNNDGDMGDFSGLKIYATLEGIIIRANKYHAGQKQEGIYLGSAKNVQEYAAGLMRIMRMMKNMELQRGFKVGAVTRYEGNDEWNYKNRNFVYCGYGVYKDIDNDEYYYDSDGNGIPDSILTEDAPIEGYYYPPTSEDEPPYHGYPEPDPKPNDDDDGMGDPNDPEQSGDHKKGGGGSSSNPPPLAPKAKAIFRNSNMINQNWEKIEKMLDKITNDCAGEQLYNGLKKLLNGKTLTIQFVDPKEGSSFNFNGSTAGIKLTTDMESNQLFHEMVHVFQAFQETESSYVKSLINKEFEARCLQFRYVKKLKEYPNSKWEAQYTKTKIGRSVTKLEEMMDAKGNLRKGSSDEMLLIETHNARRALQEVDAYSKCSFDFDKSGLENFSNMRKLSKNCKP